MYVMWYRWYIIVKGRLIGVYYFMSVSDVIVVEMFNILKDNNENLIIFIYFLWIIDLIF